MSVYKYFWTKSTISKWCLGFRLQQMDPNYGEKQWQGLAVMTELHWLPTFPNSSTLISPSLSQSNKAKASFRQSMSLAVTCLSGLTLRAGGLAMRSRITGHPPWAGESLVLLGSLPQLTSKLLLAPPKQRSLPNPLSQPLAGYLSKTYLRRFWEAKV